MQTRKGTKLLHQQKYFRIIADEHLAILVFPSHDICLPETLPHISVQSSGFLGAKKTEEGCWRNHSTTTPETPGAKMLGIFKGTMTTSQIELELTFVIAGTTI